MPVSARFEADFSSFVNAVHKAEIELKSFETGAGKVEKALTRMTDNFSGRKLIQDATLMATAIDKAGGAAALTDNELKKVNVTIAEASAKMKALGIEVPKSFQNITDASKRLEQNSGGLTNVLGKASTILGTFGIGLGAAAVVGFGKAMIANADALKKMSDRTGIGVEGLQRLQAVADDSGNSIEQVAGAVNQFQNRLAKGDATKAIEALGLSVTELRRLAPEQQFVALGKAIQGIQDPAEQTRRAMELFGKSGAELLPSLKADLDKVGEGSVAMSQKAVDALDELGDALTRMKRGAINAAGEIAAAVLAGSQAMKQGNVDAKNAAEAAIRLQQQLLPRIPGAPRLPTPSILPTFGSLPDFDKLIAGDEKLIKQIQANVVALEGLKKQVSQVEQSYKKAAFAVLDFEGALKLLKTVPVDAPVMRQISDGFAQLGPVLSVARLEAQKLSLELDRFAIGAPKADKELQQLRDTSRGLGDSLRSLGQGNFGQVFKDIGNFFKDGVKSIGTGILEGLGNNLISTGLNLAVKGVSALFGKLFDGEAKKVNNLRDEFQKLTFGSFPKMAEAAQRAGVDIRNLLNAKTVEAFTTEVEKLKDALSFQDSALSQFDDTIKKYNISIGNAGTAGALRILSKQAADLYEDFKVLTSGGVDADVAISAMNDSIDTLVRNAIDSGQALPTQFEPIIRRMRELGLLTDDVGDKFGEAELDALDFGGTIQGQFDKLIDKIGKLVEAIERGLFGTLRNIPAPPGWTTGGSDPGDDRELFPTAHTGGRVLAKGIQHFGRGGFARGTDTVPAMLTPGELILNAGQQKAVGALLGEGGRDIVVHTHNYMDGQKFSETVTKHQNRSYRTRNKVRAA